MTWEDFFFSKLLIYHIALKLTDFAHTAYNNFPKQFTFLGLFSHLVTPVVYPVKNDQPKNNSLNSYK